MNEIRRGRRFLHKRLLDPAKPFADRIPALCQITAFRHNGAAGRLIYYGVCTLPNGEPVKKVSATWYCNESYFLANSLGSWQD